MTTALARTSPILALAFGFALLVGCASKPVDPGAAQVEAPVTEVSLEAPTVPDGFSPTELAEKDAAIALLRAENASLENELDRLQERNRSYQLEAARLREEVYSRPVASGAAAVAPPASVSEPIPAAPPEATGLYSVQTASYSNSTKGQRAAKKLADFFRRKGYDPVTARESGKYLIVLVGAYPTRDEARSARNEISGLDYYGRKGDFASATIRKN